ncbi:ABC transporter permease [Clostridium sp. Marseille-Q2269]|uniref:ABC transporter permease n=1 Tax=Clostridium sp. Marseille-Q2269 TaxID=2942205 RepID=UPI00207381E0|nr:ABC transporter permease [Clostridium sp. Marseille-Q2269]
MKKYILKRLLMSVAMIFGVSIIIFVLIQSQPGDPYSTMLSPNISKETVESMLREIGYYDPLWLKYVKWIKMAVVGNFGYSIKYKIPVIEVISSRLCNTFILVIASFIISAFVSILGGVQAASNKNSSFDRISKGLSFIGLSIPTFFFGLLLIKWFSFDRNILPTSGMVTIDKDYTGFYYVLDVFKHMIMPTIVLALTMIPKIFRYTRSSMIDSLEQQYIITAQAKGLNRRKAIWKHGFRNSMTLIITIFCMDLPALFSKSLITETIFSWPGIGRLNYDAVLSRDYPLIMGIVTITTILIISSNFLSDVLCAVIDPRIRLSKE